MTEIVNLNGFDIRFELHGEGIPMVYMPGGFYPLEQGRLMAERLTALGYQVLLWDRPNTGESGLIFSGDNLLEIWADKLRELLHYTGLSPAIIAGGSAGGLGALYFAYLYPAEVKDGRDCKPQWLRYTLRSSWGRYPYCVHDWRFLPSRTGPIDGREAKNPRS